MRPNSAFGSLRRMSRDGISCRGDGEEPLPLATAKASESTVVNPDAVKRNSNVPLPPGTSLSKVATPATAATVTSPCYAPPDPMSAAVTS